ncbi:hypothetical protein [Pseudomonas putida]
MGASIITRLTVTEGTRSVSYDINKSDGLVYLEETECADVYRVLLHEGRYEHLGDPAGFGKFDVDLASGSSLRGVVVGSVPARTGKGIPVPDVLELKLRARNSG